MSEALKALDRVSFRLDDMNSLSEKEEIEQDKANIETIRAALPAQSKTGGEVSEALERVISNSKSHVTSFYDFYDYKLNEADCLLLRHFLLKPIKPRTDVDVEQIVNIVKECMQDQWDDYCADTGCYPDDFKYKRGKMFFEADVWAGHVGEAVKRRITSRFALVQKDAVISKKETASDTVMIPAIDLERVNTALEIAVGYTALVSEGVGNMPILKERAKDDTRIISESISILEKHGVK